MAALPRRRHVIELGAVGGQVWVTGPAGRRVRLTTPDERAVSEHRLDRFGDRLAAMGVTDALRGRGGLVVRDLPPGVYGIRVGRGRVRRVLLRPDEERPPDYEERVRGQRLDPGYGYVETRDGTRLSRNITLPDPDRWGPGPYATLIQYSAYAPSRPDFLTGDPERDTGMNTEANAALLLGFAVVGLNARGSGGSGGAFRMWERVHGLDGHDVVEVVAAQPWCRSVGMIGRSGPGFTQLLVAATRPPSLGAITPASVLARGFGTGRRPGGIPNVWVDKRLSGWSVDRSEGLPEDAHPPRYAPGGWDDWVVERIGRGEDPVAAANQILRGQTVPPLDDRVEFATSARDQLTSPLTWAPRITCPTLVIGAWQDQESGPGWADLMAGFPPGTDVRMVGTNGTHEETRFPEMVAVWADFLSEVLRGEALVVTPEAERYLQAAARPQLGENDLVLAARPRRVGPVTLRLENGNGPGGPGRPTAAWELGLSAWPPAETETRVWSLGAEGTLVDGAGNGGVTRFRYDPSVLPQTAGGDPMLDPNAPDPRYDWREPPEGFGLEFLTEPFSDDVVVCGSSSVDLWLRCTAPDVDLEVLLTEVRIDGWETYLQAGWLRASFRTLDPTRSTATSPVPSYREDDVAPLPSGQFSLVRVPVPAVAHPFRSGSRLALRVQAPGGTQPYWTFAPLWPDGRQGGAPVLVEVGTGPEHPSRLAVEVLAGVTIPAAPPPPGALRRQPSRRVASTPCGNEG